MSKKKDKDYDNEAFMKRLDRLSSKAEKVEDNAQDAQKEGGFLGNFKGLGVVGKAVQKAGSFLQSAWDKAVYPVVSKIGNVLASCGKFYLNNVWKPLAYRTNEVGEQVFSKKGAATALALTLAFTAVSAPMINASFEGAVMATTSRTETVYINYLNSHGDGTYSVRGCEKDVAQEECSAEDTVYYNVEPSLARNIWSYATQGTRYLPRKIVGPVSYHSENQCDVTIYDAPWEWAWEQFDAYPELLTMTCVKGGEIDAQSLQQEFDAAGKEEVQVQQEQAEITQQAPAKQAQLSSVPAPT